MSIVDKTNPEQTTAVEFEFDLKHAPEKVWRALPVVDLHLKLEPNAAFKLQTQPFPGWDGIVNCRMIEIDTHRKLSYAWDVNDMGIATVVTFTLTPTATGTHLTMVQAGFTPEQKQNFGGARYGWKMMGGKLVDLLRA
jgi:uncharacterized protein YndB with AHSA1/START domain